MKKSNFPLNLFVQLLVFSVSLVINFFLAPFITLNLGIEAYGFTLLANQIINIFSLLLITVNSMAGRFISISFQKNEIEKASKYFSSLVYSNWIFVLIFLIPSIIFVNFLEKFINIPSAIEGDVKILYFFLIFNYFFGLIFSTYSVSTFITNKIYLSSLRNLESNLVKFFLIFLFYFFLPAKIFYLGLATLISSIYIIFFNIYYKNKLIPQIKLGFKYYDFNSIIEVSKSGFWNLIIRVGQLLLEGMDLLISNFFFGPLLMGTFALSKTIPGIILSLVGAIVYVFSPDFTILYARNKLKDLEYSVKMSIKILGLLINIPISLLLVFGKEFYLLWIPHNDFETIYLLSSISVATLIVSGSINSLYGIFTVTNKLKLNSLAVLLSGFLGFLGSLYLINFTNLGIYSIGIASGIVGIFRNLFITLPFGAKYLGLKWNTFYIDLFRSLISLIISLFIGFFIKLIFQPNTWTLLFLSFGLTSIISLLLISLIIFSRKERNVFFNKFLKKNEGIL
jgi:O-antigen/teichoic acid export membrane protein